MRVGLVKDRTLNNEEVRHPLLIYRHTGTSCLGDVRICDADDACVFYQSSALEVKNDAESGLAVILPLVEQARADVIKLKSCGQAR